MQKHVFLTLALSMLFLTATPFTPSADKAPVMKTAPGTLRSRQALADSLAQELARATTARDSMVIANELFDVSDREDLDRVGGIVYSTALRLNDSKVGLDIIRNLSNKHTGNDSLLMEDRHRAQRFPPSDDRDETLCFIGMMQNFSYARTVSHEQRFKQLSYLLRRVDQDPPEDLYDHILLLHSLCVNIASVSGEQLLSSYIKRLDALISKLRPEAYALRNAFYVQAAMSYSNSDLMRHLGIEYDRRSLRAIDSLDHSKRAMHRKFRDYDGNRYVVYTRLLSNYDSLSVADVERIYEKVQELKARNHDVQLVDSRSHRPEIFYLAKHGDYRKMFPLLKEAINEPYNENVRQQFLPLMIKSAKEVGDREALMKASLAYNEILEKRLQESIHEKWKEVENSFAITALKQEYESEQYKMRDRLLVVSIVAAVVFFILLILFIVMWNRSRSLAANLTATNDKLQAESQELREVHVELEGARKQVQDVNDLKAAFIKNTTDVVTAPLQNISEYAQLLTECSDAQKNPALKQYADFVHLNTDIISVMLSDLKSLSEIGANGHIALSPRKESLKTLCEAAIKGVEGHLKPGVKISLDPNVPDIIVNTDSGRLMQILWQLLSNAVKFTVKGSIEVSYKLNAAGSRVAIFVSDTGVGIPVERQEDVFKQFIKLNKSVPGAGIGLTLARYFSKALGGSLDIVDREGWSTTFMLTLPVSCF